MQKFVMEGIRDTGQEKYIGARLGRLACEKFRSHLFVNQRSEKWNVKSENLFGITCLMDFTIDTCQAAVIIKGFLNYKN